MKRKNKKKILTSIALSLSILWGGVVPCTFQSVHAQENHSSESIISKLTPEQRSALMKMQVSGGSGIHLNPDVNLESDEKISIIVEFEQKPKKVAQLEATLKGKSLKDKKAKSLIDADHATFQQDLKKVFKDVKQKAAPYKIKYTYKHAFNGVSMTLPANKVESLLTSDAVKAVWSNDKVQIAPPILEKEKIKSSSTKMTSSNSYLGVDKLHEEGFTGKGVKIGVLDTGIDYNHPDLEDAYKGGYDFVDNDSDPMETTYQNWKKSGKPEVNWQTGSYYYTEHGTHVSGIIAGQGKSDSEYSTTGVAPDSDLYVYRVLGPYGTGTMEAILAGVDKAVSDQMDVINLSLGANINDPLYPSSIALNNAVLSGVTTIVAAGNSGNDMYTLGSPGSSALALTVGASDVPVELNTFKGIVQAGEEELPANVRLMAKAYSDNIQALQGKTFSIVDADIGRLGDYSGKDVAGKLVLVARGEITLQDKMKYAKQKGAAGVLIYNNNAEEGQIPVYLGEGTDFIPTFSLSNEEGVAIQDKLQAGNASFTFAEIGKTITEGDSLADFSSRGPSRTNYDIKPEVIAPGVSIMSTIPSYINSKENENDYQFAYQRLSGTSMASPFVAGVAAVLLQSDSDLKPEDIKSIIMNTADPLKKTYSVFEVGSGRVDPYEAVHSNMEIEVLDETPTIENGKEVTIKEKTGALSFGMIVRNGNIIESRNVYIENKGEQAKTFDVNVTYLTGVRDSKDAEKNGVTVKVEGNVKVKAGKSVKNNVFLTIPKTAEFGTYEGYITYTNEKNTEEVYQVPFAVRLMDEGIQEVFLNSPSMTNNPSDGNFFFSPYLSFGFQLKSPMKTIDLILADGKTGEDIGYAGWIDTSGLYENIPYGWVNYDGYYRPFTNNENQPISDKAVAAEQGHYKLKLIGTSDSGKKFTIEKDFFIDNKKPELKTNLDGQTIIEHPIDQTSYPLSATLFDHEVSEMQSVGLDIDQTKNRLFLNYSGASAFPDSIKQADNDGQIQTSIPLDKNRKIIPVRINGIDSATNRGEQRSVIFIKEGTPYVSGTSDKKAVKPGETVKYTLNVQNAKDLKEVRFTMTHDPSQVEIVEVKARPEISAYGDAELDYELKQGNPYMNGIAQLTIDGTREVTGNIPMIDVYVKVKEEKWFTQAGFQGLLTVLTDTKGEWKFAESFINYSKVYPTTSIVSGNVISEGLLNEDSTWDSKLDYSTVGTTVKLTDPQQVTVEQNLSKFSSYRFENVSLFEKAHTVKVDVPGHFTYYDTADAADREGDILFGKLLMVRDAYVVAGDVNKDNVIDIMDALTIQEKWETNNRAADINFDGVVNHKDIKFVKQNYLKQNSTLEYIDPGASPLPKEKYNGKTLEAILKELGVE
ncbi:S8 family serine peptidase [Bacillus haikouensis]|uniref:S8 family serine peptidase n=1 Tax=Bacillus haikouensis TaxID=1510468 RepID=UPI001556B447|nr:S8 family serine peptidase [Bacillus haikouensis]NQD66612.1 S8 family serine peptidase [Bacillus haikouensis]